jgi:predicted AlkP superfamily phosphohydrolase/phosphomutase
MLLILGLDGATLDLVEPWAADGTLPTIAALMRRGAWGRLASTVPPITFPSWTTFMTGVNPGRHGIFDFTRREAGQYRVQFVNATHRRAPSVWRLLSSAGRRVAVLGLPGTYPPEAVNGVMISGFDTPVTTRADASFVYPERMAGIVEQAGGFPFADFQEFRVGPEWCERALHSLVDGIRRKTNLTQRVLSEQDFDCVLLLFGESDTAAHHFWRIHDPCSPRYDAAEAARLGDGVKTVYAALDRAVADLIDRNPMATVLVVSDHGFGGAGDTAVYLNRWLAAHGWLAWRSSGYGARVARQLRTAAVTAIPEQWQARCFRLAGGRLASRVESGVRFGGIDWPATTAFSEELNYFPSIWVNRVGHDVRGTVSDRDYARICAEIAEGLRDWKDPLRGCRIVREVWHRDQLYRGPHVDLAPDLILDLETPGGYSYLCLPSRGRGGNAVEQLSGIQLRGGKLSGMSGSHRPDGLFLLAGEGVAAGELQGAQIADMAPTILTLCGVQPPDDWDGRALPCVESPGWDTAAGSEEQLPEPIGYGEADEREIEQRLAQLGYLE